jgi:hypothetical protein
MKTEEKNTLTIDNQDLTNDYNFIVKSSENTVVVQTEWTKNGDYFQKFSMYDSGYTPVKTLGQTTLTKCL